MKKSSAKVQVKAAKPTDRQGNPRLPKPLTSSTTQELDPDLVQEVEDAERDDRVAWKLAAKLATEKFEAAYGSSGSVERNLCCLAPWRVVRAYFESHRADVFRPFSADDMIGMCDGYLARVLPLAQSRAERAIHLALIAADGCPRCTVEWSNALTLGPLWESDEEAQA